MLSWMTSSPPEAVPSVTGRTAPSLFTIQDAVLLIFSVVFFSLGGSVVEITRKWTSSNISAAASVRPRFAMLSSKLESGGINVLSKPLAHVVGTWILSAKNGPSSCQQTSVSKPDEIS